MLRLKVVVALLKSRASVESRQLHTLCLYVLSTDRSASRFFENVTSK